MRRVMQAERPVANVSIWGHELSLNLKGKAHFSCGVPLRGSPSHLLSPFVPSLGFFHQQLEAVHPAFKFHPEWQWHVPEQLLLSTALAPALRPWRWHWWPEIKLLLHCISKN